MPREHFQHELEQVQESMLVMASMVSKAIERSVVALKQRDERLAHEVIADDVKINQQRFGIEEQCLHLIVTQQPMASDLRVIVAVLHIITDLERMGDHAEGIAKIALMEAGTPPLKPLIDIPRMDEICRDMLAQAMDAYVARDTAAARQIAQDDDKVDVLYDQVYRELLTFMMADPHTITQATHLLWVAHNLERIADRVTNICERVVFLTTGRMDEINVSKY
ncbi:MAG TPA: phosphate signaling complex protein PhoU [Chloroflexia bacterium]|nr:phosphate signaling complex protein PhoU [Chloroflexia bacterium]